MSHDNRDRLTVDPDGDWRQYAKIIPHNYTPLGTVTRDGQTGALVRIETTGVYVQLNGAGIRNLPGRKIAAALGLVGRPAEMAGGRRVNVYLDAESLKIAADLGNGNVSEGIRTALRGAGKIP